MIKTSVTSSNVAEIGWENDILYIVFNKRKALYQAPGATLDDYNAFVNAPSVGKHFHADIKLRFNVTEVPADQAAVMGFTLVPCATSLTV